MKTAIKTWGLYLENFTKIDYIWITGLGCALAIKNPEPENITLPSGTRQYFKAAPEILITTTCEKQQSMLQLKYGDSIYLKECRIDNRL